MPRTLALSSRTPDQSNKIHLVRDARVLAPTDVGDAPEDRRSSTSARPSKHLTVRDVRRLALTAVRTAGDNPARANAELSDELRAMEADCTFSPAAAALFQQLLARLGVASTRPISLPLDRQPYWLRSGHPLANYQSRSDLPAEADVVIIGAGLTGASAAYH